MSCISDYLKLRFLASTLIACFWAVPAWSEDAKRSSLVTESFTSEHLRQTRTGLDPKRSLSVYLPPSYSTSQKRYPVIYYFHSLFWNNTRMFADGVVQKLFDRAIVQGLTEEFILVAADYSTPTAGSFFENSSTTGRWLDFTVKELMPYVDRRFRTIPDRNSRGLAGDMMGGYGALKLAMLYPEHFGVVYALHPYATGAGLVPMADRPDWRRIHQAKTFGDLNGDILSQVFLAMSQAFLPNPKRPPFYCDFIVEIENGAPKVHLENARKLKARFLLDHMLEQRVEALRSMRAIKFDWGRYDVNQDHVYANQVFTRKLDELGIEHAAEEYRGNSWDKNWIENGRVYGDMLPFFGRHLVFTKSGAASSASRWKTTQPAGQ